MRVNWLWALKLATWDLHGDSGKDKILQLCTSLKFNFATLFLNYKLSLVFYYLHLNVLLLAWFLNNNLLGWADVSTLEKIWLKTVHQLKKCIKLVFYWMVMPSQRLKVNGLNMQFIKMQTFFNSKILLFITNT